MKKNILVAGVLCLALLSACSPVQGELVGRWEYFSNEDKTAGAVFEFREDDTCLYYEFDSAYGLLYPALREQNVSRYKATSNSLELTYWTRRNEGGGWNDGTETGSNSASEYTLAFLSEDELQLTSEGGSEARIFKRAPLPEMPFEARLLLGKKLLREDLVVVEVKQLEGDWQATFPEYAEAGRDHFIEIEDPQQWAVILQRGSDPAKEIYIFVEGQDWWGTIRLEKPG